MCHSCNASVDKEGSNRMYFTPKTSREKHYPLFVKTYIGNKACKPYMSYTEISKFIFSGEQN